MATLQFGNRLRFPDLRQKRHLLIGNADEQELSEDLNQHKSVFWTEVAGRNDINHSVSIRSDGRLIEIFLDAQAVISPPSCGACLGGHMGILAEGERAIATTNRNFVGRMGHPKSEVYLASPAVAAASAILGRIAGPAEL